MTMSLLNNYYYYGLIIFPSIHKWIIIKPIKNIKENIGNYQVEVTQCHHQGIAKLNHQPGYVYYCL
jgi:hypothetical protein